MIENCTLYFPQDKINLKKIFPGVKTDGGLFKSPTWFEYLSDEGIIRLNIMNSGDVQQHINGFSGYIAQLPNSGQKRSQAQELVKKSKTVMAVILPQAISEQSQAFDTLAHLLQCFDGIMFVHDSVMLKDRTFIVGPLAVDNQSDSSEPIGLIEVDPEDFKQQGNTNELDPARLAMRNQNYLQLGQRGFRCALWLPLYRSETIELRPAYEIVSRLFALKALFMWVSAPEEIASDQELIDFVNSNNLKKWLTEEEAEILKLTRDEAQEQHTDSIGWKLENMWALSWIFNFEPKLLFYQGQIPDEVIQSMLLEFLPGFDCSIETFIDKYNTKSVNEIDEMEDLFYCAHNAVRSAQTGANTVPENVHPVISGGAVHERRHSLTWALSPGVDWEDTDLST